MAWLSPASRTAYLRLIEGMHVLVLAKIEVLANGVDIALRQPVSVDTGYGNPVDAPQITRAPRPQGEGLITNNPENVTFPETWRPIALRAHTPKTGVQVHGGLFATALNNNVQYLLDSFTVDDLLRQFRQRAGMPWSPCSRETSHTSFWQDDLAGSNAGRFLMGAGNSLRWLEHAELRSRLDAVVAGIAECRQPNGYIMAYPEDSLFYSERGAYTRAWVTHGLIDAGYAGNTTAFELLRGYYDWYNNMPHLPEVLRGCNFGPQGTVANTRLYFTPLGRPEDIQVVQQYLQENYWLDELAARNPDAMWQYPYDRPHCYLITFLEPYLDLYRATGERRYLDAVLGGWDLIRDNWQAMGGSITLEEMEDSPPKANPLFESWRGETCGSAFWILLNQRLHLLAPEEEKYVAEIEKSIYNILLANQAGSHGIRPFTRLTGKKSAPCCDNSCCEGQGTRILGSLPEYIYSIADDGIFVNLFESSTIRWRMSAVELQLDMKTQFPYSPEVRLTLHTAKPNHANIRIRVPSWAAGVMEIQVNGRSAAIGRPGSYASLDREWADGDVIHFVLPIALKVTQYAGVDQVAARERFFLEYGPLLMAMLNTDEAELKLEGCTCLMNMAAELAPKTGMPLHFESPLNPALQWVPYFEIGMENFSCAPMIARSARLL